MSIAIFKKNKSIPLVIFNVITFFKFEDSKYICIFDRYLIVYFGKAFNQ